MFLLKQMMCTKQTPPFPRKGEYQFIKIQIILSISISASVIYWYMINYPKHSIVYFAHKSIILVLLHEDGLSLFCEIWLGGLTWGWNIHFQDM